MSRTHTVQIIQTFARLYLEVETGRRSPRALRDHATPALWRQLHATHFHHGPMPRIGAVDYNTDGTTLRAAVTVYRGGVPAALALTFRRTETGWRLAAVEAPERQLLAGL